MRCRSISNTFITRKVMANTNGIESATTVPVRQPRLMNETINTIMMASPSDSRNSSIDDFTTSG